MNRLAFIFLALVLTGCSASLPSHVSLNPVGDTLSSPAVVLGYERDFNPEYTSSVPLGSEITAVDGTSIHSMQQLMSAVTDAYRRSQPPVSVTLSKNNETHTVSADLIFDPAQRKTRVTLVSAHSPVVLVDNHENPPVKIIVQEKGSYLLKQGVVYWSSNPAMLSVIGYYHASNDCTTCRLESIRVEDTGLQQPLTSIPNQQAAAIILPVNRNKPDTMDIRDAPGSLRAQNARVQQQNAMIQSRASALMTGNLSFGELEPLYPQVGSVFFALPPGSKGPYKVITGLAGTENTFVFEMPGQ